MKKAKGLGYQPLAQRSGSPLDRVERGISSDQGAPSRASFNPSSLIGRRASAPVNNELRGRSQRLTPGGKLLAPGQVCCV